MKAAWDIFVEGDDLYDAMEEDIASAGSNIRMESYMFASDVVGNRIAAALAAQARRGRRVQLRVDYAGSRLELGGVLVRELREAGVLFEWSRRWQWRRPREFHRRNHRKLLIIDEAIAYTGGFNVHAASSRRLVGQSRWRDTHVRFRGPAVRQAIAIFDHPDGETQDMSCAVNHFWLMPNATRHCRWRWRCELDGVFRGAARRIWLTTPYFVPDRRLRRRLARAASMCTNISHAYCTRKPCLWMMRGLRLERQISTIAACL
jgi:cardiolipin synthase